MQPTRRLFLKHLVGAFIGGNIVRAATDPADELLRKRKVTGAAITLIERGQIASTRLFGLRNREDNSPVDADTVFEAASLSKPAYAFAVLKLVADKKLTLDQPLLSFLRSPFC